MQHWNTWCYFTNGANWGNKNPKKHRPFSLQTIQSHHHLELLHCSPFPTDQTPDQFHHSDHQKSPNFYINPKSKLTSITQPASKYTILVMKNELGIPQNPETNKECGKVWSFGWFCMCEELRQVKEKWAAENEQKVCLGNRNWECGMRILRLRNENWELVGWFYSKNGFFFLLVLDFGEEGGN